LAGKRYDKKRKRHFIRSVALCGYASVAYVISVEAIAKEHVVHLCERNALDWLGPDDDECGNRYYSLLYKGVVLDDLGAECPRNEYGVKRDMVGEYIAAHHLRGNGRLFITTNLTAEQIYERYGGRVADRLKELCVPLAFKGKSKRQWMR